MLEIDYCQKRSIARPKFMSEAVKEDGTKQIKVWVEQDSQRLELPTLFSNYEDGRERLAKSVLNWLRLKSNAATEK